MDLKEIVSYLDHLFQINEIDDPANNGLQVEASTEVERVGLAVDSSLAAFESAACQGVDLLIVHHGLFWEDRPLTSITGVLGKRVDKLVKGNVSLYAIHLPLDIHRELGNNVQLARQLNLTHQKWFGAFRGVDVALEATLPETMSFTKFIDDIAEELQVHPLSWHFGSSTVRVVGIASGKATFLIPTMVEQKVDCFLTGETSHNSYHLAKECGLNVVFAGHYATETLGLKTLGEHLHQEFGLDVSFLDFPTGL